MNDRRSAGGDAPRARSRPGEQDSAYRPAPIIQEHAGSVLSQERSLNTTKILYGVAGLVVGFAISFFAAKSINKNGYAKMAGGSAMAAGGSAGPPSAAGQQAAMGSVRDALENARNNPNDFNA